MEHTILDKCDVEELTEEELYDLYGLVLMEVQNRELLDKFNDRLEGY